MPTVSRRKSPSSNTVTAKASVLILDSFKGGLSDLTEGTTISHKANLRYHDNGGIKTPGGYFKGGSNLPYFDFSTDNTNVSPPPGGNPLVYEKNGNLRDFIFGAFPSIRNSAVTDGFSMYFFDSKKALGNETIRGADLIAGWRSKYGRMAMCSFVEINRSAATGLPDYTANTTYTKGTQVQLGGKILTALNNGVSNGGLTDTAIAGMADGDYTEELDPNWTVPAWAENTFYKLGAKILTAGGSVYLCRSAGTSGANPGPAFTDGPTYFAIADGGAIWDLLIPNTLGAAYDINAQQTYGATDIIKEGNNYWVAKTGTKTTSDTVEKAVYDILMTYDSGSHADITESSVGGGDIVWQWLGQGMRWTLSTPAYLKPIYHFVYGKDNSVDTPYGVFLYSYDSNTNAFSESVVYGSEGTNGPAMVPLSMMVFHGRVYLINNDNNVWYSVLDQVSFDPSPRSDLAAGYFNPLEEISGTDEPVELAQYQGRLVVMCKRNIIIYSGTTPQGEGADLRVGQIVSGNGLCFPRMCVDTGRDLIFLDTDGVKSLSQAAVTGDLATNTISEPVRQIMQPYIDGLLQYVRDAVYTSANAETMGAACMTHDPGNHCIYIKFGYETSVGGSTKANRTFLYDYKFKLWSYCDGSPEEYRYGLTRSYEDNSVFVTGVQRGYRIGEGHFGQTYNGSTYDDVTNPLILETAWMRITKSVNVAILKMIEIMSMSNSQTSMTLEVFLDYDETTVQGTYTFTASHTQGAAGTYDSNLTYTMGSKVNPRFTLTGRGSAVKLRITQANQVASSSIDHEVQINRISLSASLTTGRGQ